MTEILFHVVENPDGGFVARAAENAIFTEADTIEDLREHVRDAVACHFDEPRDRPRLIRLHFTREETLVL